jgi:O-antigen ligase
MIFWTTYHVAASSRAVRRLTVAIVLVGIASGAYGLVQWLSLLGASLSDGAAQSGVVATGTFGNRNHYAFFQEMALLTGLGWLLLHWRDAGRRVRDRVSRHEARARTSLFALGIGCIGLSLLFSLSRSGITFAVVGIAALFFMSRGRQPDRRKLEHDARPVIVGLALCLVATALWIGIDPVLTRFELVPQELARDETGRTAVWRDSLGAVEDFWLTGSGLSSFQYVFPIYRSFGGRRFYSWAHNDYLQLAVELGLPGLFLAGLIIAWIVRRAYRVRLDISVQRGWSHLHAGYCAAALAAALHSFTDFGLRLPANALLFSILIGVITGLTPHRVSRRREKSDGQKLRRSPPVVA